MLSQYVIDTIWKMARGTHSAYRKTNPTIETFRMDLIYQLDFMGIPTSEEETFAAIEYVTAHIGALYAIAMRGTDND